MTLDIICSRNGTRVHSTCFVAHIITSKTDKWFHVQLRIHLLLVRCRSEYRNENAYCTIPLCINNRCLCVPENVPNEREGQDDRIKFKTLPHECSITCYLEWERQFSTFLSRTTCPTFAACLSERFMLSEAGLSQLDVVNGSLLVLQWADK